ncbi:MAG: gfo/Idh/MocA family oxidoreductase [Desulfobacteraceae bacterium]|nr:MAG: gfo/Idh/MocA family oxidoreductase [Desulfobacteraceae bacterium]
MATVTILGQGRMGKLHEETWKSLGYEISLNGEIVSIATPDWHHGEAVLTALYAGKHVFCEKPLCTTADQLSKIQQAKGTSRIAVNLPLRYHPPFQRLREAKTGLLYLIEAEYNWGRLSNMKDWRLDPRYSIIHGGGVHMMDMLNWLTGQRPVWHSAIGNNKVLPEFRNPMHVQAVGYVPVNGPLLRLGVDFSYDGSHSHVIRLHGRDGAFEVKNFVEVDKTVCIRKFHEGWDNFDDAVSATIGCLAVESRCTLR